MKDIWFPTVLVGESRPHEEPQTTTSAETVELRECIHPHRITGCDRGDCDSRCAAIARVVQGEAPGLRLGMP